METQRRDEEGSSATSMPDGQAARQRPPLRWATQDLTEQSPSPCWATGSLHLLQYPRGTQQTCAHTTALTHSRGGSSSLEGAKRRLREPDQKFHLEAARCQGLGGSLRSGRGDWCKQAHVTDPSLSSCPKMGSGSHEQATVPHRAADKQKTDSISTK